MRFMLMIKADAQSEAGVLPTEQEFAEMGRYNSELIKAGAMLDGAGLHPSSKGAKVKFRGGKPTVVDGPFSEAKELIAGFWIIQAKSKEEAIEWAKRVPFTPTAKFSGDGEIEVRQVYESEDFGPAVEAHDSLTREALRSTGRPV
ncbi:MAG TPA: YciI family protein [Gemmatimonadaceae bacterium]|nr:YciI family protein [Gemmatimonadaceae bacterium]